MCVGGWGDIIIIVNGFSTVPIYHTRLECRVLHNNTNNTCNHACTHTNARTQMHAHKRTHTHTHTRTHAHTWREISVWHPLFLLVVFLKKFWAGLSVCMCVCVYIREGVPACVCFWFLFYTPSNKGAGGVYFEITLPMWLGSVQKICSELLSLLQPKLVWWWVTMCWSVMQKNWVAIFKVKATGHI